METEPAPEPPSPLKPDATTTAMALVEVQYASTEPQAVPTATLVHWALHAMQQHPGQLCVRIVDAEESQMLNHTYRGKDYPTNVLSFPADADLPGGVVLGDLAICAPVVAAEAAAQGKPLTQHWAHMLVHGILHLQGYDHDEPAAAATMETLEIKLLADLGMPDPYWV